MRDDELFERSALPEPSRTEDGRPLVHGRPYLTILVAFCSTLAPAIGAPVASAQPSMRFSLRPEVLALSDCLARPGNVPVPLDATNVNLEILNWATTPGSTAQPGEFFLRFKQPVALGTILAYEPGSISFSSSNQWRVLRPMFDSGRKLQSIPLPPETLVEALQFTIAAKPRPGRTAAGGTYQATLPFVTLLPIRAVNLAPRAVVTASSSGTVGTKTDTPEILVDGLLDSQEEFSPVPSPRPGANWVQLNWALLTWPQSQTFRGLALFRGLGEDRFAPVKFEIFTGRGDPRAGHDISAWQEVNLRATTPGHFCGDQFFVSRQPLESRGLRISSPGQGSQLRLGEIAVLSDPGIALALESAGKPPLRTWPVTRATGRIRIDGKDDDWPPGRTNGFALMFDDQLLYVLYQAGGADGAFDNQGTNLNTLFQTGDVVDLQLQTRAGLDEQRTNAGPGDIRLLFSLYQGRPVCVLYDFRLDDLLVLPVSFESGGRVVQCDKVTVVSEVRIEIRRADQFTLEAAIPLKSIHLEPRALGETRGDVGRIYAQGRGGTGLRLVYWSNPRTNAPPDLSEAASLRPAEWGQILFSAE